MAFDIANFPKFSGELNDKRSPKEFMSDVERTLLFASTVEKKDFVDVFKLFLVSDSPAMDWYEESIAGKVDEWKELVKAFHTEFPTTAKARPTQVELENELLELKLKEDELLKRSELTGQYRYIDHADDLLKHARAAKIVDSRSHITAVRKNLPRLIREKVKEDVGSWVEFVKAIKEVPVEHIRDGLEKREEERKKDLELERKMRSIAQAALPAVPMTPNTTRMTNAFANTSIQSPRNDRRLGAQRPYNTNPFAGNEGGDSPLSERFRNARPNPSMQQKLSPEQRAALRRNTTALPHHPDTPEGRAAYNAQVITWAKTYGDVAVSYDKPFPLRPGTMPVCSHECWNCGMLGHASRDCRSESKVFPRESAWRRLCMVELRSTPYRDNNSCGATPTPVNLVDEEGNDLSWVTGSYYEESQGNGDGSTA